MNIKTLLLSIIILYSSSCATKTHEDNTNEVKLSINIDDLTSNDIKSVLYDIELIPLETSDSILIGKTREVYNSEKFYIVRERKGLIYLFDKQGNYISNSSKSIGNGPEDYSIVTDVIYNQYTDCIDILSPRGEIMSYDSLFRFKQKKKINIEKNLFFNGIFPLNENSYALLPSPLTHNGVIYFYDIKHDMLIKKLEYDTDIAKLTSMNVPFSFDNGINYYSPSTINMHIYKIDDYSYRLYIN